MPACGMLSGGLSDFRGLFRWQRLFFKRGLGGNVGTPDRKCRAPVGKDSGKEMQECPENIVRLTFKNSVEGDAERKNGHEAIQRRKHSRRKLTWGERKKRGIQALTQEEAARVDHYAEDIMFITQRPFKRILFVFIRL